MTWTIQNIPASRTKAMPEAIITDSEGRRIANLHGTQVKNAPLIAEAPNLLYQLEVAIFELERCTGLEDALVPLRDAAAKAKAGAA